MTPAYIALGGNVGPVPETFRGALDLLGAVTGVSSLYETEPLRTPGDATPMANYQNAACGIETELSPLALLDTLQIIEAAWGRIRTSRWAARPLDLDLLIYGDRVIDEVELQVPHPGLRERLFVLRPLAEIAPSLRVPPDGVTVATLLARHPNPDRGIVRILPGWRDRVC